MTPIGAREVELFERSRPRLEAIAYRLLGLASDAEDAVQDTFLRWQGVDHEHIRVPEAWLTKTLTNVCLTLLTSARVRRESYVGQWLPEPVLAGDRMLGPAETVEQRDSVSFAMLTLLERLTPRERAVYVLREAFDHSHAEIAQILDTTEANCQQIYRRAKQHLAGRARAEVDAAAARRIAEEFLTAALSGDTEPLLKLLTEEAVVVGDGGGKVPARATALEGTLRVARFLRGLFRSNTVQQVLGGSGYAIYAVVVNGGPGLLVAAGDQVAGVLTLEVTPDGIAAIRNQVNPDKLERLTRRWAAADRGEPLRRW